MLGSGLDRIALRSAVLSLLVRGGHSVLAVLCSCVECCVCCVLLGLILTRLLLTETVDVLLGVKGFGKD